MVFAPIEADVVGDFDVPVVDRGGEPGEEGRGEHDTDRLGVARFRLQVDVAAGFLVTLGGRAVEQTVLARASVRNAGAFSRRAGSRKDPVRRTTRRCSELKDSSTFGARVARL
jgi:hypothetical protein